MAVTLTSGARPKPFLSGLRRIRKNIAQSMVGRQVDLLVNSDQTARGIVDAIQVEAGEPKLVVAGMCYGLSQVLTVTPAAPI
jgi:hypothetical protein